MLAKIVETDRRISCEVFGFSIEDFKIDDGGSDRILLFLRPHNSSNRYQLLNRFELAEQSILKYPREIPILSLEASLHRIFQPVYQTVSVGGIYDAFGMSRISTFSEQKFYSFYRDVALKNKDFFKSSCCLKGIMKKYQTLDFETT